MAGPVRRRSGWLSTKTDARVQARFRGRSVPRQSFWAPMPSWGSKGWPQCCPGQLGAPGGVSTSPLPTHSGPRLPAPSCRGQPPFLPELPPQNPPTPPPPCSIHMSPHCSPVLPSVFPLITQCAPLTPPHAPFNAPPCSPERSSCSPQCSSVLPSMLPCAPLSAPRCTPLCSPHRSLCSPQCSPSSLSVLPSLLLHAPLTAPLRSLPPASCPSISPPSRGSSQGWSAWSPAPGQARWSLDGVSVPVFLLDIPHPHEQPAPRTQDAGVRVWAGVCPVGSARPSLVDGGREGAGQAGGRRSPQSHRAHTPSPQASRASREVSLVPTSPLNLPGRHRHSFSVQLKNAWPAVARGPRQPLSW